MYPHVRSLGNEDEIEEERRVLYVAVTRARDELIMTRSMSAGFGHLPAFMDGSDSIYFLRDLPEHLGDREVIDSMHADEDDEVIRPRR